MKNHEKNRIKNQDDWGRLIHPEDRELVMVEAEKQFPIAGKFMTFVSGLLFLFGLYLISLYNYLLFHGLAEIFSIVVACGIFMIAWNSREFLDNNYILLLGIAYPFIGAIDLVHTLGYKGMGVFKGGGTNLPCQLWIAARYMEGFTFLAAPFFLGRKLKIDSVFAGYIMTTALFLVSIFYGNIFPDCFVEGVGLTPFKKVSEYIICMILIAAVFLLFKNRKDFDSGVLQLLTVSIITTLASELAFTLYKDAYGISNLIGHFLKIISFYFIYKAIIETGLVKPYSLLFRNLKHEEQRYRDLFDNAPSMYVVTRNQANVPVVEDCNRLFLQNLGYSRAEVLGRPLSDFYTHESAIKLIEGYKLALKNRFTIRKRQLVTRDGQIIDTLLHAGPESDVAGQIFGTLAMYTDIREHKRAEEELESAVSLLRASMESTADGILVVDRNSKIIDFNQKFIEMWSIPESLLASQNDQQALSFVLDQIKDPEVFLTKVRDLYCQPDSESFDIIEFKDGRVFERYSQPQRIGGKSVGRVWSFRDVTERRRAERQIKTSLKEKEVLLKEIHHRVKNNLQVITSLLNFQVRGSNNEQVKEALKDSQTRVQAMALVHESLYRSDDFAAIDFKPYILNLTRTLFQVYGTDPGRVKLNVRAEGIKLRLEKAVHIGLIINEMVSNSLKYAFPDRRAGEITVDIRDAGQGELELVIADNGVGLPEGLDWRNTQTVGFQIVIALVENQFHGIMDLNPDSGVCFTIRYKGIVI
jgi:PAS domain S-box-containing protein